MLWRIKICSHETKHPIRMICARGPNFLPVDDEVIPILYRSSARLAKSEPEPGSL